MNIIPLKVVDKGDKPSPEVIAAIESLLTQAKAGTVTSLAYAAVKEDGSFQTWWAGGKNMNFSLCAGIARLNWRYQNEAFSETETGNDHGS